MGNLRIVVVMSIGVGDELKEQVFYSFSEGFNM